MRRPCHFNDANSLFGRYSINRVGVTIPALFPDVDGYNPGSGSNGVNGTYPGPNQTDAMNFQLNYVHILKNNMVAELNASYMRDRIHSNNINSGKNVADTLGIPGVNLTDAQTAGIPYLSIQGFQAIGDANFTPLLEVDSSFEYKGSLNWTKGRHDIKIGLGVIRRQFSMEQSTSARGAMTFNGSAASAAAEIENGTYNSAAPTTPTTTTNDGAGLANLLLGTPVTISRSLSTFMSSYRTWEPNIYAQDNWRITNKLTLNLGVRYDVFPPKTEVKDRISSVDISTGQILYPGFDTSRTTGLTTSFESVSPRVGFSATLAKDLALRGGYGVSFFPGDITSSAMQKNPPFTPNLTCGSSTSTSCSSYGSFGTLAEGLFVPTISFSTTALNSGLASVAVPSGSTFVVVLKDFKPSYQQQMNVLLEKGLGKNVISVGYVGSIGRNMVMNPSDVNRALPSGTSKPNTRPLTALNSSLGSVAVFSSTGISSYNALQGSFQRRLSKGISANAGYTYSHEIDDVTGLGSVGTSGYGTLIGSSSTFVENIRKYDRSTGDFNVGHQAFVAVNYDLPKANVKGLLNQTINGWQLNGTEIWHTGMPITVTNSTAVSGITGLTTGERPNRVKQNAVLSSRTNTAQGITYLDSSAFAIQSAYTLGDSGRNIVSGPRFSVLNLSMFKDFPFYRESRLQFRAEFFNLPNHRNMGQPSSTFASNSTTFGKITSVSAGDTPRQIQFALKMQF